VPGRLEPERAEEPQGLAEEPPLGPGFGPGQGQERPERAAEQPERVLEPVPQAVAMEREPERVLPGRQGQPVERAGLEPGPLLREQPEPGPVLAGLPVEEPGQAVPPLARGSEHTRGFPRHHRYSYHHPFVKMLWSFRP